MPTTTRARIATAILEWGMRHRVFGRLPDSYTPSSVALGADGVSPATVRELDDGPGFFDRFEGRLSCADLNGRDVLDLGCGFGGRTVWYATNCAPASVVGLEIEGEMLRIARDSIERLAPGTTVAFVEGFGEALPFDDGSFDAILSYDVFEHVDDLGRVLAECHRVLRPGGRVFAVFPPYFGPRAHHLDFITTLPFLHHVFSVDTLVEAANDVVARHPEIERVPFDTTTRATLPTLNGTTERRLDALLADLPFDLEERSLVPFAWGGGGGLKRTVHAVSSALVAMPWPFTRDVFGSFLRLVLRKPGGDR